MEIVVSGAALLAGAGELRDPNAAFQLPIYVTWKVIYVGPTSLCFDSTAPLAGAVVNFGQQPLEQAAHHRGTGGPQPMGCVPCPAPAAWQWHCRHVLGHKTTAGTGDTGIALS